MGLRSWLAQRANRAALRAADVPSALAALEHEHAKLTARVEKLELDRPAFVTALEEIAERCHEILDNSEAKRARVAARESRLNRREQEANPEQLPIPRRGLVLSKLNG